VAARRSALDLLSRALDREGHERLARESERVAWSGDRPSPTRVEALADEVEEALQ
jgi:hypothetical protein